MMGSGDQDDQFQYVAPPSARLEDLPSLHYVVNRTEPVVVRPPHVSPDADSPQAEPAAAPPS